MAFGNLPYKTPNPINQIGSDLSDYDGHAVYLSGEGEISLATAKTDVPYGVIAVGCDSETPGSYPSSPIGGSLEIIDSIGAVVQVVAGVGGVAAGEFVQVGPASHFIASTPAQDQWVWGYALTAASAGQQFLMRFQPSFVYYVAP
jgi:hypothetical protein